MATQKASEARDTARLAQEAYVHLVRTHEALAGEFKKLFKKHGLSEPQFNVLRILRGHGKRLQVYQVAERMVTREPDITRLFDRLVAAGWVARERCDEDRRVVWVSLTAEGKTLLAKLDRPVRALHEAQLGHLGARDLEQMIGLLCRARMKEEKK